MGALKKNRLLFACTAPLLAACVTNDSDALFSTVRSTPMGPGQHMVSCVDSPAYCAHESNRLCPEGFDVTSNTVNPSDYGRMTMIIRCFPAGGS